MTPKILVFFPTYNEVGNVERLISSIREHLPDCHLLVVDDASPDGTGALLDEIASSLARVEIVHRPGKLGVGSAHKLAMVHARDRGFDALITMDADFSHHPRYLPQFVEMLAGADFVTGSRYVAGGECDYGFFRTLISRTANLAAKGALRLGLEENTTLFRAFSRDLLQRVDIDAIRSEGYSFACESLYEVSRVTDRLAEFPIHFENRAAGSSKISQAEIYKAILTIQKLAVKRVVQSGIAPDPHPAEHPDEPSCIYCGGTSHIEWLPPREPKETGLLEDAAPYSCASHSGWSHGQILKCLQCGLIFMRPKLSEEALVGEYEQVVDETYLDNLDARKRTFRYNLDRIGHHIAPGDKVLEIGSHCGAFLKVALERGIDIMGVEPSAWAARKSAAITDARVIQGTVSDLPPDAGPFDVVTMWDVLEHLSDPVEESKRINRAMKTGGRFIFSTIMIDKAFPKLAGKRWPWLMDMHLFYFTEPSLRNVMRKAGFEIIEADLYSHIVTLDYLMAKLGSLGVPGAYVVGSLLRDRALGRMQIPFRLGDAKWFVAQKMSDVTLADEEPDARERAAAQKSNGSGRTNGRPVSA